MRGVVVLAATLLMVRLGDKRSLSQKSAFDAVLLVILASVLSRAIKGTAAFFPTLGAGLVIVVLHRALAFLACRSPGFRMLIKGRPDELICDGKFQRPALRRHHIAEEDVQEDLRLETHLEKIDGIRVARLECSGDISFVSK